MFRRLCYFSKWALMGHRPNIGPNFGKTLTLLNLTNPTDPTTVTVTLTHRPTDKPVEWALEWDRRLQLRRNFYCFVFVGLHLSCLFLSCFC